MNANIRHRAPAVSAFVESLQGTHDTSVVHVEELPSREARFGQLDSPLPDPLRSFLNDRGLKLYTHQADTIRGVRDGQHVMVTTPTASGKTLGFNLSVLEGLVENPNGTALYLYPLKALTQDQQATLQGMDESLDLSLEPRIYDGDTPQGQRSRIRERSRIVLTNPHALHQYLPWHHKWRRFFKSLQYVVIDEAHAYRGVFGSNVALLIRRLRRIAARFGAEPQFILSSATMANPAEHGRNLLGLDVEVVSEDGAPSGEKTFCFWNTLGRPGYSVHRQTSDLLAQCVQSGYQTLCFTVSRRMAELIARWTQEETHLDGAITAYRAGYTPEERRSIERALRNGELRGVASTNALELGIDVGGLDAVLIAGFPGTILSTWQMAGRAGRGERDSFVTLIGFENPLDQYYMKHPDAFFAKPHEHAIVDPQNAHVLLGHVMCAAAELPLSTERDPAFFGDGFTDAMKALERQRLVQKTPMGRVYRGTSRPVETVALEHLSEHSIHVLADGELLETLALRRACEEAYPGAVFLHRGETYLIESLDLNAGIARASRQDVDYYTDALRRTDLSVRRELDAWKRPWGRLHVGEVQASERVVGYRTRQYDRTVGLHGLDLPEQTFETVALWFTLPDALRQQVEAEGADWAGGLHAAEHALIAMTPVYAMCDRWDVGGLSTPLHPDTAASTVFIYDGHPGGVGITEKAADLFRSLAETTYELGRDCACDEGCPSCIYSPKCGNNNETLDKGAALIILQALAERN